MKHPQQDKPTVLITGASGFVGSNLIRLLHRDFRVVGLGRESLASPESFPPADAVVHLAGLAHDTEGAADEQAYREVNVELTRRIFDLFLASDAKTFIFFSSVQAVASELPPGAVLTEGHIPHPRSVYGRSKLEAEEYLLQPRSDYPGKRILILRPAMIHGPGNKGNLNLLYQMMQRNVPWPLALLQREMPWPLAAFSNKRSFAGIDNVAFAVKGLLEKPVPSGIYNLADDEPISTNEIVRMITESLGRQPRYWKVPKWMVRLLARVGDVLPLPLNSHRLRKLTESYVVSNENLKKALGVERMPVSAVDGLKRALQSFRE
jgi:nucleoside-diphosphate-sugar epimerase